MTKEVSQAKFLKVFAKTNGRCFYCNDFAEEIDHFISKGWMIETWGELLPVVNDVENLMPACKSCNRKKSATHPEDYMGYYPAWSRYRRVNRRIGIETYDSFSTSHPRKPWASAEWHEFTTKYG